MNLLKNSTLRQRLAFGTGVLAVGGLLYGVFQRHRKEKEDAQLLLKQTEDLADLQTEINILLDEKENLMRDLKCLQTRNAMLETKLSSMVALEAEKDAKKVSVRDRVLEVETKSLIKTSKENSSTATKKCPPKANKVCGMDSQTAFLEELKSRVAERLAKDKEDYATCEE